MEAMLPEAIDRDKLAVALAYERGVDDAPKVAAKGKGYVAERIIALARDHGVEIRKDPDLVSIIATTEVGEAIPVEAYMAVAEILSYLYQSNAQAKQRKDEK